MRVVISSIVGAAAAALAISGSASAAVFISTSPGAPDPGPLANETQVIDFDTGLPLGVSLIGSAAIVIGNVANQHASPAGDSTPYLVTPGVTGGTTADLDFASFLSNQDVANFSFYWGSIDKFNTVQLLDRLGNVLFTLSGSALPPANGGSKDPLTNERVEFTLTGADQALGGLRFTSTKPGFEVDTIAFDILSVIPEPTTWGLMLAGFFGMGATLRARRKLAAVRA